MKSIDETISALLQRCRKQPAEEELDEAYQRNLPRFLAAAAAMKDQPAAVKAIEELNWLEFLVLTAVYLLRQDVVAKDVIDKVHELTATNLDSRYIIVILGNLILRDLVALRQLDPAPGESGRPRLVHTITDEGQRALVHARESQAQAPAPADLRGWT